MAIWKSPFNKVVRSHEAGIVGLLSGVMLGVVSMLFVPILVKADQVAVLEGYCDGLTNIETIAYSYTGRVTRVVCKDGQVLDSF